MRTQQPHASQRDVVPGDLPADDRDDGNGTDAAAFFPGSGLCCPDDPLDLVLQLFPADRAPPPSSLAALGIGGGEPPRQLIKEESLSPKPLAESAYGSGGGGVWDSWGLSSFVLDGLCGLDEIDVDMFFADDALDGRDGDGDGGGEATKGNLLCDPTGAAAEPEPAAHITAGGPTHVHTKGNLLCGPNDASPLPAPMPPGAFPLQAYDACRTFDPAVSNNASAAPAPAVAPMPAGGPPPVLVTYNSTPPPLPALIMPAAPVPMPAGGPPPVLVTNNSTAAPMPAAPVPMPAGGPQPVFVTNNSTPPLPALIMPAAPAPALMPPAAGLHACGALPGIISNGAPALPPPLMPPMPASALYSNAAALAAGVYSSINNAPAHTPPSATPSSSPPSRASSGSGRCPSSSTTSEPEFLQPHHAWLVPRKPRSPPAVNRRKRPWLLDFPLHALPPVVALPPPANPDDDDDGDAKNRNALVLPVVALAALPVNSSGDDIAGAGGGSGGIRRRRPAPRQRNRQAQRVCSHCHSPETPQWRAGPDGPGTLCNACGIRYAANRLLPEYRPSTAPSFRSGQHSNRHRKVMKLREQMKAPAPEEKPSEQAMEDDRTTEKDDDGFMGVCEYISAAGL